MRKLLLGLIVFTLGVGASVLLLSPGAGARTLIDGTLTGSVGTSGNPDAYVIALSATTVAPGTYQFDITDYSTIHNFDLCQGTSCTGANSVDKTVIGGTGFVSWTVNLTPGTYTYQCDAHPSEIQGQFTVTGGTTSTPTTPAPAIKLKIVSILAKRKAVTVTAKANPGTHVTALLLKKTTQLASAAADGTTVKLKLKPIAKLKPGAYTVQLTAGSTTKKKKIQVP